MVGDDIGEWSETDDDVVVTECDMCGVVRPCVCRPDPFVSEVYGEETSYSYWCRTDWQSRKDDV